MPLSDTESQFCYVSLKICPIPKPEVCLKKQARNSKKGEFTEQQKFFPNIVITIFKLSSQHVKEDTNHCIEFEITVSWLTIFRAHTGAIPGYENTLRTLGGHFKVSF